MTAGREGAIHPPAVFFRFPLISSEKFQPIVTKKVSLPCDPGRFPGNYCYLQCLVELGFRDRAMDRTCPDKTAQQESHSLRPRPTARNGPTKIQGTNEVRGDVLCFFSL